MIMLHSPTLVVMVSPACHARPENIKKEQVVGTVQAMV